MRSITDVVRQFKQNWTDELSPDAIAQACRDAGIKWNDSERYTLADLAEQFRTPKTTMKMAVLKRKTVDGVLRELQVFALP